MGHYFWKKSSSFKYFIFQIFSIKPVLYAKINKIDNLMEKFDSFIYPDVLLTVN
jgi:hypothetical protein